MESYESIQGNDLHDLSEQQLVDCTNNSEIDNDGCGGGWLENTFGYMASKGLMNEQDYPYTGYDGVCRY